MYKEFPERVLADLPESIRKKISSGEPLDHSDSRVAKSYLEKTIMHPENACDTQAEAIALIRFYIEIGAKIPQVTIDYFTAHIRDESVFMELAAYERVTTEIRINMNTSPLRNQSFLSVCHINSDKGFRRWNLYAENYGKLVKSIKRWAETEATHLRPNCEYAVYIDEFHVGVIADGKQFKPNSASDMYGFIIKFFEPPIKITLDFSLTENNECNLANSFNFECRVKGERKHTSMLIFPTSPEMKYAMIIKNLKDVSRKLLDLTRFQESMSCDIEGAILLNNVEIGIIDIDSGEPRLSESGEEHLKDECGIVKEEVVETTEEVEEVARMTFMKRLKFLCFG